MTFPSLVGGFVLRGDFAPSIICAALYGILIPIFVYRFIDRRSRNTLLIGTASFAVERCILFCLRAVAANQPPADQSEGLIEYMQTTMATGLIIIAQDLSHIVRKVLVNTTLGSDSPGDPCACGDVKVATVAYPSSYQNSSRDGESLCPTPPKLSATSHTSLDLYETPLVPDRPRRRFWFRRIHDGMMVLYLSSLVTCIVGNPRLLAQRHDKRKTLVNQILRYTSGILTMLLLFSIAGMSLWARKNLERINRRATALLLILCLLLSCSGVYRLVAMAYTTTSLEDDVPGAQNSVTAKVAFYLFNMLPEWSTLVILCSVNVKETFQTGPHGDQRWRDETVQEKEKRETKAAAKQNGREEEKISENGMISLVAMSRLDKTSRKNS